MTCDGLKMERKRRKKWKKYKFTNWKYKRINEKNINSVLINQFIWWNFNIIYKFLNKIMVHLGSQVNIMLAWRWHTPLCLYTCSYIMKSFIGRTQCQQELWYSSLRNFVHLNVSSLARWSTSPLSILPSHAFNPRSSLNLTQNFSLS
jgi:hypothetical protein